MKMTSIPILEKLYFGPSCAILDLKLCHLHLFLVTPIWSCKDVTIEVVDKLWGSGRSESLPEKGTRLCPCAVVAADFLELEVEAKFGTKIGSFKLLFGTGHCICLTFSIKWDIENWKTLIIFFFQKNPILGKNDYFWAMVIFFSLKTKFLDIFPK